MEKHYQHYLYLISLGLLNSSEKLNDSIDWELIDSIKSSRSMYAILLDGISFLSRENYPPKKILLKYMAVASKIEIDNLLFNKRVVELHNLYKENNIPYVLIKGQSAAKNYPNPMHRACGDIDVYVSSQYYTLANRVLEISGGKKGKEERIRHLDWSWRDVVVENHRIISVFNTKKRNFFYQNLVAEWFPEKYVTICINNAEIPTPPPIFNAIYILHHIVVHILTYGVELRQIIDWLLHMKNFSQEISKVQLQFLLKKLDLYRAAQSIAYIGVKYLGFSDKMLPIDLPYDSKFADLLLNDIFGVGISEKNSFDLKRRPKNTFLAKLYSFRITVYRIRKMSFIAPKEAKGMILFTIKNQIVALKSHFLIF